MTAPEDLRAIADRYRYEVGELIATSRALSSERDIGALLALILQKCRQVIGADAGSVYVLEGEGAPAQKRLHCRTRAGSGSFAANATTVRKMTL